MKEPRTSKGLTQRELPALGGISHIRIVDWERGSRSPRNMSLDSAIRLADALHVRDLRKLVDD